MSKTRIFLITLVALIVTGTVFATRIYEYSISQQRQMVPVVRPGYQLFKKETSGFSFHYPIGWEFRSLVNTSHFTNGIFFNGTMVRQLYLETPYSGRGFLFVYNGPQAYYAADITATMTPVVAVSSTLIRTNDPTTPILFSVYRNCSLVQSSTICVPEDSGGFMTGVWQRGKAAPVLSERNQSSQTGVIYAAFPPNRPSIESHLADRFRSYLEDFKFNEIGVDASSSLFRWKFYYDPEYRFMLNYPANFVEKKGVDLSYIFMATGTTFEFPDEFTKNTNLSEARIAVGPVLDGYAGDTCVPQNSISTPPEPVLVNGVRYFKSVGAGAAAGNRYDTATYAYKLDQKCMNITLFLHSTVRENYPENLRPAEYDHQKVIGTFSEIFATFSQEGL